MGKRPIATARPVDRAATCQTNMGRDLTGAVVDDWRPKQQEQQQQAGGEVGEMTCGHEVRAHKPWFWRGTAADDCLISV